jgi:hypothetical protein
MDLAIKRNNNMIDYNIGLVYFLCFAKRKASKFTRLQLSECYQISKQYKLFTFLSVDMEILTPWNSQVHNEKQPKGVHATEEC